MITFSNGAKIKDFIGHLILATWGFYLIAGFLPVGVTIGSYFMLRAVPTALALAVAYGLVSRLVAALCAVRDFGRFGELQLGWCVSSYTIWLIATNQLFFDGGIHVDGALGAIAGGAIVTALTFLIATVTGYVNWFDDALWPVRRLPVDVNDQRSFEAMLDRICIVRVEHENRKVYEEPMVGHVKLMLRDYAPYVGQTVLYIDGELCGAWTVEF